MFVVLNPKSDHSFGWGTASVFERLGFAALMLIVADILTHCAENGIAAVPRGSAVSALTIYLLGGSPVDPVEQGLLLERFLHPGKNAWPDVDLDLPWHRRAEVIAWVLERYGPGQAARVSALHRFRRPSALREGLKAMGVSPAGIREVLADLPGSFAPESQRFPARPSPAKEAYGPPRSCVRPPDPYCVHRLCSSGICSRPAQFPPWRRGRREAAARAKTNAVHQTDGETWRTCFSTAGPRFFGPLRWAFWPISP